MKKILLVFLIPFLMGTQCQKEENCHKNILLINNSSERLYVVGSREYPDTLDFIHDAYNVLKSGEIKAHSNSITPLSLRDCYEAIFHDDIDKLQVYVFNADTVDNNDWSYIYTNYKVKRYELTLEDLQYGNWTITYP